MTLGEILILARQWLDDDTAPYLWSDDTLTGYANEAQKEACVRARLLVDSTTEDVCVIVVEAGTAEYALHESIIVARRIQFTSVLTPNTSRVLDRTSFDTLDINQPGWRNFTGMQPECAVQDLGQRLLVLSPTPTQDGTITLTVWRYPLEAMEDEGDEPEIPAEYHNGLAHWICHRAFSHKDSEQNDLALSEYHEAKFTAYFGDRPTAQALHRLAVDRQGGSVGVWF